MSIELPTLIGAVLLCAGAIAMLVAARGMRRLRARVGEARRADWRTLRQLAVFFVFGAAVLLLAMLRGDADLLALLASVLFAFGGLFVLRVVRVGQETARELEDRRRRLEDLLAAMVDAVAVVGEDGAIRRANDALCRLLGVERDALVEQPLASILAGDRAEALAAELRSSLADEREIALRRADGRTIPMSVTVSPLRDADGRAVGVVLVGRDLRDRLQLLQDAARVYAAREKAVDLERAYETLEEQSVELERSNTELQQFAYVASHDLQEPLRMVTSYLQLLERRYGERLDSQGHEFIGFAVDGAERMRALIMALLDYSRVESRMRVAAPVELQRLLAQVTANLREAIRESGATLTHDPLPEVLVDEAQVGQLLQNLVGNAIKFRGEASPTIHLSATRDGAFWRLSLRDNGIGIDPAHAERIFQIFQRLHGRDRYEGTGIGLAICKKIVELHGGRIWVEANPEGGTTLLFTLPAAGALDADALGIDETLDELSDPSPG